MIRAVAKSAASALCLIWAAGCASTSEPAAKPAANPPVAKPADVEPEASSDVATIARNLPATLDGEIRRAQQLRAKGDYDEAVKSLAQLMLFAPDDARVVGEYGKVLEQEGHSREALAFLKRAVELAPRDWSLHSALGVAYDQVDDRANARVAYERALSLRPRDPTVLNNYAVSRMLAGDYAGARRLFALASAQDSSNPKIARNLEKLASLTGKPAAVSEGSPPAAAHLQASVSTPGAPQTATEPKTDQVARSTPNAPQVVMQRVPDNSMMATSRNSHNNPRPSQSQPVLATRNPTQIVVATPKPLGPQVVMERVPFDPLAGPVKHTRVAKAAKPKPAAQKPVPAAPSLRTAADTNN